MADPTGYTLSYSFSGYQANAPTTPLPGPKVDNEFASIAAAVASIISAIKDVRRSDGGLIDGLVTFASLEPALKFTIDPTNGQLVAAAVATAQAASVSASGFNTSAGAHDTAAAASAAAAALSAGTVNLSLYLPKAGNLAGIGSANTARFNINAANIDGSDMIGRLESVGGYTITNWNNFITNGWGSSSPGATNAPDGSNYWVVQTISAETTWITQIAYPFALASTSVAAVTPMRRHSYDDGSGGRIWQPWESYSPVPIGSTIWVNGTSAPPGFLKENGALISRAAYPALYTYAAASGNIVSEATWAGGAQGAFSTGDLSTTFRLMDSRGEFIRGYDDGRGIDAGRVIGNHQADSLKDHTHSTTTLTGATITVVSAAGANVLQPGSTPIVSGSPSTGAATETRPRNNAKLACIKY